MLRRATVENLAPFVFVSFENALDLPALRSVESELGRHRFHSKLPARLAGRRMQVLRKSMEDVAAHSESAGDRAQPESSDQSEHGADLLPVHCSSSTDSNALSAYSSKVDCACVETNTAEAAASANSTSDTPRASRAERRRGSRSIARIM